MFIYSVYDSKAEAYLPPFFLPTKAAALRAFGDAALDPKHQFAAHPEDYTLFELGTYDETTGVIVPHDFGKLGLGSALDFRRETSINSLQS
jgi:hypothetical protein